MAATNNTTLIWRAVIVQDLEEEEIREKEYLYQQVEFNEKGSVLTEETFLKTDHHNINSSTPMTMITALLKKN